MLQFQRWLEHANISASDRRVSHEPVADWVVADIIATRGTYLGGKQFVNLPLWSSEYNRYILRKVAPEKGRKEKRLGVVMDPTRPGPRFAVVDVEGGTRRYERPKGGRIEEETANEVLLMDENGGLVVRSSYADRFDNERGQREKAWLDWIDAASKDTGAFVPNTPQQKKDDFK